MADSDATAPGSTPPDARDSDFTTLITICNRINCGFALRWMCWQHH